MKKLLGIVVFILFWCNVGFADLKVLNKYFNGKEKNIKQVDRKFLPFTVYIVCVDELKFLMTEDQRSDVVDIEQMIGKDGKPQTCKSD